MGVAGSGKTVIGSAFARALDVDFIEGDEFHSAENVAKMARGVPLTDEDRAAWLDALARAVRGKREAGTGAVIACSALKRKYRDVLRSGGDVQFIFLRGPRAVIEERLRQRRGHYMPASLLDSQFATLEEPEPGEHAWVCDVTRSPDDIVSELLERARGAA
jgi:gluconokinase